MTTLFRLWAIIHLEPLLQEVRPTYIRHLLVAHLLEINMHDSPTVLVILLSLVATILLLHNPAQRLLAILVHLPLKNHMFSEKNHQMCLLDDQQGLLLPIHMLP